MKKKNQDLYNRLSDFEHSKGLLIIDYINKITTLGNKHDTKQVKMLKDILDEIKYSVSNYKESPNMLIYVERVKLLGIEKFRELMRKDQESIENWRDTINFGKTQNNKNRNNNPPSITSTTATSPSSGSKDPNVKNFADKYNSNSRPYAMSTPLRRDQSPSSSY
mmetsp:Transcript_14514/g.12324  ORF Transcript_14514/g.12324 Transcript_14514/m.12324 type:complete len:164 (+) Transcript_14514:354-845(+)